MFPACLIGLVIKDIRLVNPVDNPLKGRIVQISLSLKAKLKLNCDASYSALFCLPDKPVDLMFNNNFTKAR